MRLGSAEETSLHTTMINYLVWRQFTVENINR